MNEKNRFDIDRLFKVRGIVFAFPQRDVHLHVEEKAALPKIADSTVPKKDHSF